LAEVVDRFLRDVPTRPELRTRKADGGVEIQEAPPPEPRRAAAGRGHHGRNGPEPRPEPQGRRSARKARGGTSSPWWDEPLSPPAPEPAHDEPPTQSQKPPRGKIVR